jgi:hypothetical protein
MKNVKTNLGSFATAKLQTISRRLIVIALVAVIGFSMAACDNDNPGDPEDKYTDEDKEVTTAGQMTITGLGAYNGKKIYGGASATDWSEGGAVIGQKQLLGYQTVYNTYHYKNGNLLNISPGEEVPGTITGGQVTLKVFLKEQNDDWSYRYVSYTGNHQNVTFWFQIKVDDNNAVDGSIYHVNFNNGAGSGAYVPE